MLETPVLLVTWRRPDTTRLVLDQLAKVRPATLIVASDGPASDADISAVEATRSLFEQLSWPCEVIRIFSDFNMGLAWRVTSAIDYSFKKFDRLIVLEDDIVADQSFFRFCEELLELYEDERRIMAIRGTAHRFVAKECGDYSYDFTRFTVPWGWATWKRAWSRFDHSYFASGRARFYRHHSFLRRLRESWKQVPFWPKIRNDPELRNRLQSCGDRYAFWLEMCDRQLRHHSWAGLFGMWILENDGLVVTPAVNMTENIGFREDAVNTGAGVNMPRSGMGETIRFPLVHPAEVQLNHVLQKRIAIDTDKQWTDGARLFYRRFKPG